jgi:hypothetical protein
MWNDSGAVQNYSAAVQNDSGAVQNYSAAVQNDSGAVQNYSAAVQNDSGAVQNYSAAMQNDSGAVQNHPGAAAVGWAKGNYPCPSHRCNGFRWARFALPILRLENCGSSEPENYTNLIFVCSKRFRRRLNVITSFSELPESR